MVRLQRLDKGDRLSEVVLVPPEAEDDTTAPDDTNADDTETSDTESSAQDS